MEILRITSILGIFQLTLLIVILFLKGGKVLFQNKMFAAFLMSNSLIMISWLFYDVSQLESFAGSAIAHATLAMFFLLGPLVYQFFRFTFNPSERFAKKSLLHLLPVTIYVIYIAIVKPSIYLHVKDFQANNGFPLSHIEFIVYCYAVYFQLAIYILLSYNALRKYKSKLRNQASNINSNSISWLSSLIILYSFHWLFEVLSLVFGYIKITQYDISTSFSIIATGCLLVFATLTVVRGANGFALITFEENKTKYANSPLTEDKKELIKSRILEILETEKVYLEPEINISIFSEKLEVPVKSISQVINESFNCNFFDFINGYRIKESKLKMLNNKNGRKSKTISEIMYDSGFNSKSAFNRAFKKHTGQTPTEFKNEYQEL